MKWFVGLTILASFFLAFMSPAFVVTETEVTPPSQATLAAVTSDDFEANFLEALNQQRVFAGFSPVGYSEKLAGVVGVRSSDMIYNNYYAHRSPVTNDDFSVQVPSGSGFACENLLLSSKAQTQEVMQEWFASPEHKQCLMRSSHRYGSISKSFFAEIDGQRQYLYVFVASER